jgi:hypothetical protein
MGYRSDVAYTIRFNSDHDEKNKQSFYTFLAEAKARAATAPCFSHGEGFWGGNSDGGFEVDEARYRINFSAQDVKWYTDYPDVKCHEALIELADEWASDSNGENVSGIAYSFVRIGEESNDIEEKNGGDYDWGWLQVSRSIERDW